MGRYAPRLSAFGLAVWLESIFTVEWSYPYCLNVTDGPAYAAQGWPLPYWMWNGVASLEHDFLPHVYVLNILIIFLILFPVVRWVWRRTLTNAPAWLGSSIATAGGLLLISNVSLTILMISGGYYRPAASLGLNNGYRFSDLRPVRAGFHRSNAPDCTPSHFWFPGK